jgi:hypothetical protein
VKCIGGYLRVGLQVGYSTGRCARVVFYVCVGTGRVIQAAGTGSILADSDVGGGCCCWRVVGCG